MVGQADSAFLSFLTGFAQYVIICHALNTEISRPLAALFNPSGMGTTAFISMKARPKSELELRQNQENRSIGAFSIGQVKKYFSSDVSSKSSEKKNVFLGLCLLYLRL